MPVRTELLTISAQSFSSVAMLTSASTTWHSTNQVPPECSRNSRLYTNRRSKRTTPVHSYSFNSSTPSPTSTEIPETTHHHSRVTCRTANMFKAAPLGCDHHNEESLHTLSAPSCALHSCNQQRSKFFALSQLTLPLQEGPCPDAVQVCSIIARPREADMQIELGPVLLNVVIHGKSFKQINAFRPLVIRE